MILNKIIELYPDENFLTADGFDDAIIGVDTHTMRLIYSTTKIINILMKNEMSEDEAFEYFDYNISGAYYGEKTPIWCEDDFNYTLSEIRKQKLEQINFL